MNKRQQILERFAKEIESSFSIKGTGYGKGHKVSQKLCKKAVKLGIVIAYEYSNTKLVLAGAVNTEMSLGSDEMLYLNEKGQFITSYKANHYPIRIKGIWHPILSEDRCAEWLIKTNVEHAVRFDIYHKSHSNEDEKELHSVNSIFYLDDAQDTKSLVIQVNGNTYLNEHHQLVNDVNEAFGFCKMKMARKAVVIYAKRNKHTKELSFKIHRYKGNMQTKLLESYVYRKGEKYKFTNHKLA